MKRVLILMNENGGGHRASAEALRDAFRERYGAEFQVDVVDLWTDHTPWPLNRVPKTYPFVVNEIPWFYRFIYRVTEKPQVSRLLMGAASKWVARPVRQAICSYAPDLIISVHPLMQDIPLKLLAQMQWRIPFVTVVTDLTTLHPTWLHKDVTLCFVGSDEAYRRALQVGLRPEQLRQYGLPIRPAFARQPRPQTTLRQELGMLVDVPTALIVSGGEGVGRVGEIARAIAVRLAADGQGGQLPAGQLVVVCGRNQKLQDEMEACAWPIPTIIKGFVENIWDWMAACDCIITKAGPGTIAEACALGLPILLSGYIPGQESGNVPYVLRHGVGVYVEAPEQIAEVISRWFGPERASMLQMAEKARQLGRPQATFEIVEEIAALLGYADH